MRLRFKIVPAVIFLFVGAIIYAGENIPVQTFGNRNGAESFAVSRGQQDDEDSLVTLIQANSAKIVEIEGKPYREIIGDAIFFHNNTYLKCDSAKWDVTDNIIRATGNVKVIQENTFLTGDNIDYIIDSNLAKVSGALVELYDKERNILRTTAIDYYTKDSIGFFYNGGVMQSNDGSIMESNKGYYFGKEKRFSFKEAVEVFIDSTFISSDVIDYYTEPQVVRFGHATTGWKEDNMLYANNGTYNRGTTIFNLTKDGYIISSEQEVWGDNIIYNKTSGYAEINRNAQVLDTVQKVILFGDLAIIERQPYINVVVTKLPALAMYSFENGRRDTIFMRADTLRYYKKPLSLVDSVIVAAAAERQRLMSLDPLTEIDKEAAIKNPNKKRGGELRPPVKSGGRLGEINNSGGLLPVEGMKMNPTDSLKGVEEDSIKMQTADSLKIQAADTLKVQPVGSLTAQVADSLKEQVVESLNMQIADSLTAQVADSLSVKESILVETDTVFVTFVEAYHKLRLFRGDIQAVADSLVYTNLDSIARFYVKPILWSDTTNQVTSDSMQLLIVDNALKKANFLSNAFIATQEDSVHYNQIKSTEMMAYFNNNDIYRFDALGGVTSAFYLQEDSIFTSINIEESKLMTTRFKNRELQHVRSISDVKSDVKPLFNLPLSEQRLRGFEWHDTLRPKSRAEITTRAVKSSQRQLLTATPFPAYNYTGRFFKESRDSIFAYKYRSDSIIAANRLAKQMARMQKQQTDSTAITDSIATIDSIKVSVTDTLNANVIQADTLVKQPLNNKDSVSVPVLCEADKAKMTKRELRAYERKQAKLAKKLKREERKRQKALAREERRKLRALTREKRRAE